MQVKRREGSGKSVYGETFRAFRATVTPLCDGAELVLGQCSDFSFPKHTHPEYTIGLVIKGTESIYCRGRHDTAGQGSIYFCQPDQVHAGTSIEKSAWQFASLYVAPAFYQAYFGGPLPEFAEPVVNDRVSALQYRELVAVLGLSQCDVERQSALIASIALMTGRNIGAGGIDTHAKKHPPAIKRAIDYIHSYFSNPIRLEDLAGVAGFHPGYFVDCFRKSKGITPHAYLLSTRLNAAKHALMSGQTPADTAAFCGFYDQSHLNRNFTKMFGMTPGQFRRQFLSG